MSGVGQFKDIPIIRYEALSEQAVSLWAKTSNNLGDTSWLPLVVHMSDSCGTSLRLWDVWLPHSTQDLIVAGMNNEDGTKGSLDQARRLVAFLAAAHDLGKAIPAFQFLEIYRNTDAQESIAQRLSGAGFTRRNIVSPYKIHHSLASQMILRGNGVPISVAIVLGGHHGRPPSRQDSRGYQAYPGNTGVNDIKWTTVQNELLGYALNLSGMDLAELRGISLSIQAQVLLSGLIIMADWLASDSVRFPYDEEFSYTSKDLAERVAKATRGFNLPSRWEPKKQWESHDLYDLRFEFQPWPSQKLAAEIAAGMSSPGLMIIEAPMGEGKTESALVAAEILAQRFGKSGVMFALPSQATADGLYPRFLDWVGTAADSHGERFTFFLAHGRSRYNKQYRDMAAHTGTVYDDPDMESGKKYERGEHGSIVVHDWFNGRKKGLLSDFVVGTVDQVLMCGLKQKHLAMRHLGFANKIVIIDECHAYDAYMGSYLSKALQWLGAYKVPVILLSATLPPSRRKELIDAYLEGFDGTSEKPPVIEGLSEEAYPVITHTDGTDVRQRCSDLSSRRQEVDIRHAAYEHIPDLLDEITSDGGYVGVILNTVKRAQEMYTLLSERFGADSVQLVHSRYTLIDRTHREVELLEMLGKGGRKSPPYKMIVVGTQVMEQSLDLDFDALVTDLCPMDLLIQRIGRLHRHESIRPNRLSNAVCYVVDEEDGSYEGGSQAVYGKYMLMNTRFLLPEHISLPVDIPRLVNMAYDHGGIDAPIEHKDEYVAAEEEWNRIIDEKCKKANVYQIGRPYIRKDLLGWLDHDVKDDGSNRKAEATVRDTHGSLEVILIQVCKDGTYRLLPWIDGQGGEMIPTDTAPGNDTAFTMAGCKISLPSRYSAPWRMDKTIAELEAYNHENIPAVWQESFWLKGELFLALDEDLVVRLAGSTFMYDVGLGFREDEDAI